MIKFILPAIIVLLIVVFWEKITEIVFKKFKGRRSIRWWGWFCARGKLITSKKSKDEKILPLGLTDGAIVKKDIYRDQSIKLDDVELNLPEDVVQARQYQYDLI